MKTKRINQEKGQDAREGFFSYYFTDVFVRNYLNFDGKISRKQFWVGFVGGGFAVTLLANIIAFYICVYIGGYGNVEDDEAMMGIVFGIVNSVLGLLLIIPVIATTIRRLRDSGRHWTWILISCVPFIGPLWLMVLLCKKGETKADKTRFTSKDWIAVGCIVAIIVLPLLVGLLIDKIMGYEPYKGIEIDWNTIN